MCNIAGYVGEENATPILLEMIRKQEGLNGGFFTGLAVHDGSRIGYRKVQGELKTLLNETDASSLEGKLGIIHSRTPSGGDGSWAHPFATERDGVVKMCYAANGSAGLFKGRREEFNRIADRLVSDGFDIPNKLNLQKDRYNKLSTGEAVHMSDVMCQLIYKYKQEGMDTVRAMTTAFTEMPSEIVGLVIEDEHSDRIFFSRINKPMFVGFDGRGAYLASAPMAFPEGVEKYDLLPALSSGVVYKDRYEVAAYDSFKDEVVPFDEKTVLDIEEIILSSLKEEDMGISAFFKATVPYFPAGVMNQNAPIVYLALEHLLSDKKIIMYPSECTTDGQTAPKTLFRLL